ncbi:hypothetical protein niasHT_005211 [Heterodera trifolii]|uniref:EGF-like domain-containing protein n=1 Tax=Heterodera trifolii TaxID=157864 RepID=A0ABD2LRV8_9BILA
MFASFASFPLPLPLLLSVLLLLHLPFSLAFAQFSSSSSSSVSPSLCNPREDSLFLADSSDRRAFFQCRAFAQLPSVGFWERHFCPFGMHFAYATQQCTANSLPTEVIRDRNELFQIAILNGSCANGERCIGGTVCDRTERRCLCPFGTMAVLENLFCAAIPTVKQPQKETNPWHDQWQQQMLANSIFQLRTAQNGDEIGKSNAQKTKEFERTTQEKFKKASLGEKCNDFLGEFCADQNARCEESRCRCVVPMVEQNGKCQQLTIKEAGPGELCNGGQKCVGGTKCHPKTAICVCSRDTELKKGRCERRGEAEESDAAKERANEETAKGSQAETGTDATPPAEMVPISSAEEKSPKGSRKKAKKASVGEKCSLNAECLSGAYCNGNTQPPTCQCLSTHVKVNDRCEKVIYPGQRGCETDLQCSAAYAGTRCIGRQCVCPPGSTPIDKSCIPAIAWPGDQCNITHLMPVCSADSYCFEGKCVCNPPLHLFQKQCINQRENIHQNGEEDDQNDHRKREAEESDQREKENAKAKESDQREKENAKAKESDQREKENAKAKESDQREKENAKAKESDQREKENAKAKESDQREKENAKAKESNQSAWKRRGNAEVKPKCKRRGGSSNKLGGNCIHFEAFGGKFEMEEKAMENQREEKQSKEEKDKMPEKGTIFENGTNAIGKKKKMAEILTEMSGMEQIFKALALLKSAALDGQVISEKKELGDGGRRRRELDDGTAEWGGTAGHFQRALPHNFRLEGEPCSPRDFCVDGALCVDGHCQCAAHFPYKHVPTFRTIGSQCVESADRCVGGSVCRNSICICADGSLPNAEKMLCRQSPGGRCSHGQICSGQSECRLGTCHCRAGMRMALQGDGKTRKCTPTLALPRKNCRKGEKCIAKSIDGSTKLMGPGKGDDENGPKRRGRRREGQRGRKSKPGESCAEDELCTGGSFCGEKSICICAPGESVQMENGEAKKCMLQLEERARDSSQQVKAEPGQLCVEGGMECSGGAKCQNGICSCPEGHTLFRTECLPPRALPISIEKIYTHSAFFAPQSAVMDRSNPIQNRFARGNVSCPYRTECVRGVCRCQRDETIVNGMCRKTIHEVLPGARCDTQKGLDCVGESHCFYGICVCLYGLVNIGNECANANVLEKVAPGKRCLPGQHCLGMSKCVKGKCQCAKGQKLDSKLRRCIKVSNAATVTTPLLAFPSGAEVVVGPTSIVEIPLGNSVDGISESDGAREKPTKFIYAIPAALAAAAEEGKFQQILTANQMSINLMDGEMRSLISKLIEQQKQSNETVVKRQNICGGERSAEGRRTEERPRFGFISVVQQIVSIFLQLSLQSLYSIDQSSNSSSNPSLNRLYPFKILSNPSLNRLHPFKILSNPSLNRLHPFKILSNPSLNRLYPFKILSNPSLNRLYPFKILSNPSLNRLYPFKIPSNPSLNRLHPFKIPSNPSNWPLLSIRHTLKASPAFFVLLAIPIDGFCQIAKVNLGEQCFLDEQCKANGFCIGGVSFTIACHSVPFSAFCYAIAVPNSVPCVALSFAMFSIGTVAQRGPSLPWAKIVPKRKRADGTQSAEHSVECANVQLAWKVIRWGQPALWRSLGLSSSDCHKFAFCDNGFCSCKIGFERIAGFCLPPARPVVDDPKAYFDPEKMAELLNKNANHLNVKKDNSEGQWPNKRISPIEVFQAENRREKAGGSWTDEQRMDDSPNLGDNGRNSAETAFANAENAPPFPSQQSKTSAFSRHFPFANSQLRFVSSEGNEFLSPNSKGQFQQLMLLPPTIGASFQHFPAHSKGKKATEKAKRKNAKNKAKEKQKSGKQKQNGGNEVAKPGEYCGTNEKRCAGNSKCLNGWCQCGEGAHVQADGMCVEEPEKSLRLSSASSELLPHKLHLPFDSCFSNRPCIHGASCVRSAALLFVQKLGPFCQCNPGLVFLHNQCIPRRPELKVAKPGERCRPPSVICDFGAICGEESICKCPAHRKLLTGLCVRLALPGESCANGEFCADAAICAPGLNACVCQVGWNVRNGKCHKGETLRKLMTEGGETWNGQREGQIRPKSHTASSVAKLSLLLYGQHCQFDSDCAHLLNAHCSPVTRKCACEDGFSQLYSSVCVPENKIKLPGEECLSSAHFCGGQSWCKNGRCACIGRDSQAVEGQCVRKASKKRTIRRNPPRGQSMAKALDCSKDGKNNGTKGQCATERECPEGTHCSRGKCHCREEAERGAKLAFGVTSKWAPKQEKEEQKMERRRRKEGTEAEVGEEEAEGEADLERDYALGEPKFGGGAQNGGHRRRSGTDLRRRQQQRNAMPFLPGTFCDSFSHRLAFVNGVTKCVAEEEKKGKGAEKNTERRKRDGKSDANCTNCSVLPNKSSTSELQRKPNGPFAKLYHQKNSKGSKISVPGELCGPFESCAGGSSCVEGFCLCPAGTRPSPASGNCETFAQQRKMTKTLAEGRKSERNGTETEKGTAPKAIAERRANQTPNEPTNVPIADPLKNLSKSGPTPNVPIAADPRSPLTDVRSLRIFNQNLTGRETRILSTDAKKIVNIVPNLLQNATEINVKERAYARPSESCSNGEICTGGSICDQKNKICECPSAKRMLRNHICIRSNELPMIEAKVVKPGELCDSETKCVGNSVCVEGSCRCRKRELRKEANEENGEKDRRDLKKGEALPPVQLKLRNEEEDEQLDGSAPPPSSVSPTKRRVRMHARPRISGPPLRRPSPSSPSLAPAGTNGVCPRGNAPLIDQKSGLLVQCNGMTPNCPPKSYCFVTGVASEVYNCCKSY